MKTAIGTSLMIISFNSLIGFLSSVKPVKIEWKLLVSITVIAVAGIIMGSKLSKKDRRQKTETCIWVVYPDHGYLYHYERNLPLMFLCNKSSCTGKQKAGNLYQITNQNKIK